MSILFDQDRGHPPDPSLHHPTAEASRLTGGGASLFAGTARTDAGATSLTGVNSVGVRVMGGPEPDAITADLLGTSGSPFVKRVQSLDGPRTRSDGLDRDPRPPLIPESRPLPFIESVVPNFAQDEGNRSAFRAVGSENAFVNSPAVKPGHLPHSPHTSRRLDSSDQETVSPTPSSTASESQPDTPAVGESARGDAFTWPAHSHYDENRQLLGTEEESSERQSSDEDEERF